MAPTLDATIADVGPARDGDRPLDSNLSNDEALDGLMDSFVQDSTVDSFMVADAAQSDAAQSDAAQSDANAFDASDADQTDTSPHDGGTDGSCSEDSSASDAVGSHVFAGTIGARDNVVLSCGVGGSNDVVRRWRAPRTGRYLFDTIGSNFDTVLALLRGTGCNQANEVCNDDVANLAGTSALWLDATIGEEFLVVVEDLTSSSQNHYNVNITLYEPTANLSLADFQAHRAPAFERFCEVCGQNSDDCRRAYVLGPEYTACETAVHVRTSAVEDPMRCLDVANVRLQSCLAQGCDPDCLQAHTALIALCPTAPAAYLAAVEQCRRGCPIATTSELIVNGRLPNSLNNDHRVVNDCNADGPETWIRWTPPHAGTWRISSEGSDAEVRVSRWSSCQLQHGECLPSEYALTLADTTPVLLLVDSVPAAAGRNFRVTFDAITCPAEVSAANASHLTGVLGAQHALNVCNGEGPEVIVAWTPPAPGRYLAHASSNAFDPTLGLIDSCNSLVVTACNDNQSATDPSASLVILANTTAPLLLAVDSTAANASGAFALDFGPVPCFEEPLIGTAITSTLVGRLDSLGACRGRGADRTFTWTAPLSATFEFRATSSTFDTILSAHSGTCATHTELACNDDDGGGTNSRIVLNATAGQTYLIVVDTYDRPGEFNLSVRIASSQR